MGFALGAWGISKALQATAPAWVGVSLSMMWLFVLIVAVMLMSGKRRTAIEDQRRLLIYGLLAAVLVASFLLPIFIYKVNVPKWAAELVILAISGAVFLFSKRMERQKLQRDSDNCR